MSIQINLSQIEEKPQVVPDEIKRLNTEALQILWRTSQDVAQQQIKAVKERYQKFEVDVMQQRQDALDQVEEVNKQIVVVKDEIKKVNRENRSLEVDLKRQQGELKSADGKIIVLQDKIVQQEQNIKNLTEELGRARESAESFKKRLYVVERQAEQDHFTIQEVREELAVNVHNSERLENNLKTTKLEADEVWKQLKLEERRAAVAETLVNETKDNGKKYEVEIKQLKAEKLDIKAGMEAEAKVRVEMEKKVAALTARMDSQELGYKEKISRLEQELDRTKNEATTLRNRMIKAESGYEREKNALERLESKLVAASRA